VLNFRPWLYAEDPPVKTNSVYWTENHQALYSSIEYLAGQLYPEGKFTWLGKPGSWHLEHGRKNLLVWLGSGPGTGSRNGSRRTTTPKT